MDGKEATKKIRTQIALTKRAFQKKENFLSINIQVLL